jgi:phospholipid/cholesterol/gamma-HCH transport system substrate-binding protein
MLTPKMSRSRAVRRVITGLVVTGFATATLSCSSSSGPSVEAVSYCALMSDSIGLYVGNPVTQMGFPIGAVTAVEPSATHVRVNFSVAEDRPLPSDVRAVTRSPSILADRALELIGNYESGPQLAAGECIPMDRTATPKSLSAVIGSATEFVNSVSPEGATSIAATVGGLDAMMQDNGRAASQVLTASSALLDNADGAISDIGSIIRNLADLTTMLTEMRGPLKQILLDAQMTTPEVIRALEGGRRFTEAFPEVVTAVADLEENLGEETQLTLESLSMALRKMSPHANAMADLLNPVPWWINTAANHFNKQQFTIAWRPPMYRIPTHDGLALCGFMNTTVPGSCADVAGQPYAVDVALLQYVLMKAKR